MSFPFIEHVVWLHSAGAALSDNLFAADLLAQRHAPAIRVVTHSPTEHWLGPLHPWLEETCP